MVRKLCGLLVVCIATVVLGSNDFSLSTASGGLDCNKGGDCQGLQAKNKTKCAGALACQVYYKTADSNNAHKNVCVGVTYDPCTGMKGCCSTSVSKIDTGCVEINPNPGG